MTLISKTTTRLSILLFGLLLCPTLTFAQDAVSLSVSPTLFDMSANPGQEWTSTIRVINTNPFDMNVYTEVVNFEADGEAGKSRLVPLFGEESNGNTLGDWIDVTFDEIIVPAQKTIQIPFKIIVPEGAAPGGHFAAIMIGTKSLDDDSERATLETSQVVTSLIFLRVAGDVIEDGSIRSFRTIDRLLEEPRATFELRFENKGNVHLQPQGEIKIFNMWGQERGLIPINKKTLFGNVLPDSVRAYTFEWTGEWSMADIGRYKAEAAIAYGASGRQFAHSETSFWVLPWKIAGIVLLTLVAFVLLFTWSVKLYIRRMLSMSGMQPDQIKSSQYSDSYRPTRKVSVIAPIEAGILDLRDRLHTTTSWKDRFQAAYEFIRHYKIFFGVTLAVLIFVLIVVFYIKAASVSERNFKVTIDENGNDITISSRNVTDEQIVSETDNDIAPVLSVSADFPPIELINQSGTVRLGAELRDELESKGYNIVHLQSDFGATKDNTVIVYDPQYAEEALLLSRDIVGSLLSAFEVSDDNIAPLTVYIGNDFQNEVQ